MSKKKNIFNFNIDLKNISKNINLNQEEFHFFPKRFYSEFKKTRKSEIIYFGTNKDNKIVEKKNIGNKAIAFYFKPKLQRELPNLYKLLQKGEALIKETKIENDNKLNYKFISFLYWRGKILSSDSENFLLETLFKKANIDVNPFDISVPHDLNDELYAYSTKINGWLEFALFNIYFCKIEAYKSYSSIIFEASKETKEYQVKELVKLWQEKNGTGSEWVIKFVETIVNHGIKEINENLKKRELYYDHVFKKTYNKIIININSNTPFINEPIGTLDYIDFPKVIEESSKGDWQDRVSEKIIYSIDYLNSEIEIYTSLQNKNIKEISLFYIFCDPDIQRFWFESKDFSKIFIELIENIRNEGKEQRKKMNDRQLRQKEIDKINEQYQEWIINSGSKILMLLKSN